MNFCEIILPSFFFFSQIMRGFFLQSILLWKINLLLLLWNILIVWVYTKKALPHIKRTKLQRDSSCILEWKNGTEVICLKSFFKKTWKKYWFEYATESHVPISIKPAKWATKGMSNIHLINNWILIHEN